MRIIGAALRSVCGKLAVAGFFVTACSAQSPENIASIEQIGSGNTAIIAQVGQGNTATIVSNGERNEATLEQNAAQNKESNTFEAEILGQDNYARIEQSSRLHDRLGNEGLMLQSGRRNTVILTQNHQEFGGEVFGNSAIISQFGKDNTSIVDQTGADNTVELDQTGNENFGDITQNGQGLSVELSQNGNGLTQTITQTGCAIVSGCGTVRITQSGN